MRFIKAKIFSLRRYFGVSLGSSKVDTIYIYRVSHLNLSPPITRLDGQVSKKVSYKSCMVSRGT